MKVVYKYAIHETVVSTLELPKYSKILCVQMQQGKPKIWALVDTKQPLEARKFLVIYTGQEFQDSGSNYIGTYQVGALVYHLFEVG